jgi:cytochrome c oxidase subunit 2
MAFEVVALPAEEFERWYELQLLPAPAPANDQQARGLKVFLSSACVVCHEIAGTSAGGRVGPNLTHVASRASLAAGTIENNRGHLMGWLANSQEIKPGNRMPPNPLEPAELDDLTAYLETLK